MIYIILFPMNNCKHGAESLGRINAGKRVFLLLHVRLGEQGQPASTLASAEPCNTYTVVENWSLPGLETPTKEGRWAFGHCFPISLPNQDSNPLCPMQIALAKVRRPKSRQKQVTSGKSQGTAAGPLAPVCFPLQGRTQCGSCLCYML